VFIIFKLEVEITVKPVWIHRCVVLGAGEHLASQVHISPVSGPNLGSVPRHGSRGPCVPGHATSRNIDAQSTDEIRGSPYGTSKAAFDVHHDDGSSDLWAKVRHVRKLVLRPTNWKALLATLNWKRSKGLTGVVVQLDCASRWYEAQRSM
jgi:hypothetical protein